VRIVTVFACVILAKFSFGKVPAEEFREIEKRVRYFYPDSLLIYSNTHIGIFENIVISEWAKGRYHFYKSEFDKAFEALTKAKSRALKNGNYNLAAEIALDVSNCLSILENTGKSLEELMFAKKVFEISGSKNQVARTYIAIGELYRKIGQYDKSTVSLEQVKLYTENDHSLLASYYNRKAAVMSETGKMDSAYIFSKLSLAESRQSGDISIVAGSHNELGYILKHMDKKDSAMYHFRLADSIFRKCGMIAYALQSSAHYGILLAEEGTHAKAIQILNEVYRISSANKWYRLKRDCSEYLRNSYLFTGNKDSTYHYSMEMKQAQIDLLQNQYSMNTRMVESMFEEEKYREQIKEKEQQIQNEKVELEKAESDKKFMFIFIILIIIVLLFSVYISIFQVKRRKQILAEKTEKEKQNMELQILLKNNEALVQEISHRVKNNLSVLSGLLGIQKERASNTELKNELQQTIYRIESISAIHNQFYDSKENANINLKRALSDLCGNLSLSMGYQPRERIKIEMEDVTLDIARAVNLSMILNELLTNSFKYAVNTPEDLIMVKLKNTNGQVKLTVADMGNGILQDENNLKQKSTASMGFYLVDLLCRQLKAEKEMIKEEEWFSISVSFNL